MNTVWSDPLTQEQCDRLPAGTRVLVIWTGGNGPCEYVTGTPRNGHSYVPGCSNDDGELTFVGALKPRTIVRIPKIT
jgi:hypothetical protein